MTPGDRSRTNGNDLDQELPAHTTEELPATYDYRSRFPNARVIAAGEGGADLVAEDSDGARTSLRMRARSQRPCLRKRHARCPSLAP